MGYGEIYNTTWWGVALDTARTAGTEPDFFGSQMKLLTSNQPELVTNGDFATDSDWTKTGSIEIANGQAIATNASTEYLFQSSSLVVGKFYKITFTVSDYISGIVRSGLSDGLLNSGANRTANGTYTDYIKFTGGNTYIGVLFTNNASMSIDNVSIKVVRLELDQIEAKKCLADWIHTTALQDLNN